MPETKGHKLAAEKLETFYTEKGAEFRADMEAYRSMTADTDDQFVEELIEKYGDDFFIADELQFNEALYRDASVRARPSELYFNTAGEIEARDTAKRRDLTAEERAAIAPNLGGDDTVFAKDKARFQLAEVPEKGVDFKSGRMSEEERKERIRAVVKMDAVANLNGGEFTMEGGRLVQQVSDYFDTFENRIVSPYIGTVELRKRGAKDSFSHGVDNIKATAFHAVPYVIEKGIPVDFQYNWKGREYETVTIVAPITIQNEPYMMAVVVKQLRDQKNKFYLHEVEIERKNSDAVLTTPAVSRVETDPDSGGDQSSSIQSLLRKIVGVKSQNSDISDTHMNVTAQTMYGGQNNRSLATAGDASVNTDPHSFTSETTRGTASTTDSIQQKGKIFNPQNSEEKRRFQLSDEDFDWLDDGDADEVGGAGYDWLDEQVDGAISQDGDGALSAQLAAVRAESRALEGVGLSAQQTSRIAKEVLREYQSSYGSEKVAQVLGDALQAIKARGNAGFAESVAALYAQAKEAVGASGRLDSSLWNEDDVKSIRKSIRETRMYVSDKERGDFKDGYNAYRRETFGTFKLTGSPGDMSVDQVYSQLSADYPAYFDGEAVTAQEQLEAMRDFLAAVRPTYVNDFEGNIEEAALDMTAELLHRASIAAQKENVSTAVRAERARQAKKYAENRKKLRERYTEKYRQARLADSQREIGRQAKAAARNARQINKLKVQNRENRKRAAERREVTQVRHKIEKVVLKLGKELEKPTDTRHVPQEMRGAVAGFLSTIDFSSDRKGKDGGDSQKALRWKELSEKYKAILASEDKDGFDGVYMTIDPDAAARIDELIKQGVPEKPSSRSLISELSCKTSPSGGRFGPGSRWSRRIRCSTRTS